jgi:hypothetical protein
MAGTLARYNPKCFSKRFRRGKRVQRVANPGFEAHLSVIQK